MSYGTLNSSAIKRIRVGTRDVWELVLDWTVQSGAAAGNGTVELNIATLLTVNHPKIFTKDCFGGYLNSVQTIAGANGDLTTNVSSNAMSITITDAYGMDIMAGVLANRSTTVAQRVYADPPIILNSELELNVATTYSAGAKGRVIMWIEQ